MRSLPALAAAAALVAAVAAVAAVGAVAGCGSVIQIPDQGVVVLGCRAPSFCYFTNCSCKRADAQAGGNCIAPEVQPNPTDPSTQFCPSKASFTVPVDMSGMTGSVDMAQPPPVIIPIAAQCLETAQVCVGRGAFCGGSGARCLPAGTDCTTGGGDPPQLISTGMTGPALEPHCQFVDDVCCPGVDAGVAD